MYLIKDAHIVNEGEIYTSDLLIRNQRIEKIDPSISIQKRCQEINANGLYLFPGVIDDQVHFREPGLTEKGDIYHESRAAVAGGITSFMEMPNVVPQTTTQVLLEEKYLIAKKNALANYSFYMGANNNNLSEVLRTDGKKVCGVKVFMGSSTGDMLVDNPDTLENIFKNVPLLIATHCEDENIIKKNLKKAIQKYGNHIPIAYHPKIRSEKACYISSSKAIALAKKHHTRLHVLHISTGKETTLFDNQIPLEQKLITSEACIHHLWFTDEDYSQKGTFIKWNPAIKTSKDRDEIWNAIADNRIDVIATDHAPHTKQEKLRPYVQAPSGGPLVQHSLVSMLDFFHKGKISLEKIAEKMCHAPAKCFKIKERGYIKEGYFADCVLVNLNKPWIVNSNNILAKCKWSPFEGHEFQSSIMSTFVSGHLAYHNGKIDDDKKGERLLFDR